MEFGRIIESEGLSKKRGRKPKGFSTREIVNLKAKLYYREKKIRKIRDVLSNIEIEYASLQSRYKELTDKYQKLKKSWDKIVKVTNTWVFDEN